MGGNWWGGCFGCDPVFSVGPSGRGMGGDGVRVRFGLIVPGPRFKVRGSDGPLGKPCGKMGGESNRCFSDRLPTGRE